MSTATAKRSLEQARQDAEAFRDLFVGCYDRWEIAGSVRRGKATVGDIEHVVVPKLLQVPSGLFGATEPLNLLWESLDAMVENRIVAKHIYASNLTDGTTRFGPRWGDTYRGVDFRGFNNEIFCATPDNWGCILAIRTGPAEFSQTLVTRIKQTGMYRQQDGGIVHVASGDVVPVPDEEAFFKFAGMKCVAPSQRF